MTIECGSMNRGSASVAHGVDGGSTVQKRKGSRRMALGSAKAKQCSEYQVRMPKSENSALSTWCEWQQTC